MKVRDIAQVCGAVARSDVGLDRGESVLLLLIRSLLIEVVISEAPLGAGKLKVPLEVIRVAEAVRMNIARKYRNTVHGVYVPIKPMTGYPEAPGHTEAV